MSEPRLTKEDIAIFSKMEVTSFPGKKGQYLDQHHKKYPDDRLPNGKCKDLRPGSPRYDSYKLTEGAKARTLAVENDYARALESQEKLVKSYRGPKREYFEVASGGIPVKGHEELRNLAEAKGPAYDEEEATRRRFLDKHPYGYHTLNAQRLHIRRINRIGEERDKASKAEKWHGEFE